MLWQDSAAGKGGQGDNNVTPCEAGLGVSLRTEQGVHSIICGICHTPVCDIPHFQASGLALDIYVIEYQRDLIRIDYCLIRRTVH